MGITPPLKDRPLHDCLGFQNLSRDGGQVEIQGGGRIKAAN